MVLVYDGLSNKPRHGAPDARMNDLYSAMQGAQYDAPGKGYQGQDKVPGRHTSPLELFKSALSNPVQASYLKASPVSYSSSCCGGH